eukprot:5343172-Pyramimonas_sp.AAC.2
MEGQGNSPGVSWHALPLHACLHAGTDRDCKRERCRDQAGSDPGSGAFSPRRHHEQAREHHH